eukprot:4078460-Karenia_brevis.AAC.1
MGLEAAVAAAQPAAAVSSNPLQSVMIAGGNGQQARVRRSAQASAAAAVRIQAGGVACANARRSPALEITTTLQPVVAVDQTAPNLREPSITHVRSSLLGSGGCVCQHQLSEGTCNRGSGTATVSTALVVSALALSGPILVTKSLTASGCGSQPPSGMVAGQQCLCCRVPTA